MMIRQSATAERVTRRSLTTGKESPCPIVPVPSRSLSNAPTKHTHGVCARNITCDSIGTATRSLFSVDRQARNHRLAQYGNALRCHTKRDFAVDTICPGGAMAIRSKRPNGKLKLMQPFTTAYVQSKEMPKISFVSNVGAARHNGHTVMVAVKKLQTKKEGQDSVCTLNIIRQCARPAISCSIWNMGGDR